MVKMPLLNQAVGTVWPKLFDEAAPLDPNLVLDEMEKGLAAGRFCVMPGPVTSLYYRSRRLLPGVVWWRVHQVERC